MLVNLRPSVYSTFLLADNLFFKLQNEQHTKYKGYRTTGFRTFFLGCPFETASFLMSCSTLERTILAPTRYAVIRGRKTTHATKAPGREFGGRGTSRRVVGSLQVVQLFFLDERINCFAESKNTKYIRKSIFFKTSCYLNFQKWVDLTYFSL